MRTFIKSGVLALSLLAFSSHAQTDREGTWEMGATLLDLSGTTVLGPNGSSIVVDDETGFGFSGAYNFTDQFAVGLDISYSDPAYSATLVPDDGSDPEVFRANLGVDVIHFKGIFNILDNDLTPFVELGGGWTYIDSNIVSGISGPICWWDPWWGYICTNYYDTYEDTRTSYSYAVGIRWDIEDTMVFRAGWGVMDIDTNRAAEDIELDTIQVTFGWRF